MYLIFGFLIFVASLSFASVPSYQGAISSSTVGAGRATAEATVSPFLNPATLAFVTGYHFTTSYSTVSNVQSDLALTLTDALKDTILPTSLAYTQMTITEGSEKIQAKDVRLALAEKVGASWSVGLSGHHLTHNSLFESYAQSNLTLAMAAAINDRLSFGYILDDMLPAAKSIPEKYRLQAVSSAGISYDYKKVIRGKLDVVSAENNQFRTPSLLGGVETYLNKWLIIRVGLGYSFEKNTISSGLGMGFKGPKFGIHYAYLNQFEQQTRHSVDLGIPFW